MPNVAQRFASMSLRLLTVVVTLMFTLSSCGGGSSSDSADQAERGSTEFRSIGSRFTGVNYPLSVYWPPASAGPRAGLPVVYVLDGESWFQTLVDIATHSGTPLIVVAIHTAGQRSRDFVPLNTCTPNGGGNVAYFDFIRQELIPYVETTIGGSPNRRILFGHSHGASFALYAMFSQAPGQHSFKSYLASDSSVGCMPVEANGWEKSFALVNRQLPVRLHISHASSGNHAANTEYAAMVAKRNYEGLTLATSAYSGTHNGIVPQALSDGIRFALSVSP